MLGPAEAVAEILRMRASLEPSGFDAATEVAHARLNGPEPKPPPDLL